VGPEFHSLEEREAAVVLYWKRKRAKERAFAAKTAKEFGIETRTLGNWKWELKHLAPPGELRPATSPFDTKSKK
jgi:hypothetical protein